MASSSSSNEFSRPCPKNGFYDVFLSFHGKDTRSGFTYNLYHSLIDNRVYTFMDVDLVGSVIDSLFEIIGKSKMAVVVYSEGFASSDWCLRELEAILQRVKDKEMLIVPIFYKVDVHELKHLAGNTGKYLEELISKHGETAVQKWKDAVTSLGNISGLSYKDKDSRYERDFIAEVIVKIKRKLEQLEERVQITQGSSIKPYDSGPATTEQDKDERELVKAMVEDVMEKLKKDHLIPKDSPLSYNQQYILLNMACFWIGSLKFAPNYVWEDHFNGSVSYEIKGLMRSFIKIEDYEYKMQDDQLGDSARAILQQEYNDQGRQVWIWSSEEGANLLRKNKLLPPVEAICLDGDDLDGTKKCIKGEQLRNLPNLRFIKINNAEIAGNFEGALRKVSYLEVGNSASTLKVDAEFTRTIQNLSLENIVVLNLSCTGVGDDWEWSTMKVASRMKDLNLSECHQLKKGPNFSLFPNLERLDVEGCDQLESMEISHLVSLKDLDASNCKSLKDVYGLDRLENLNWVNISGSKAVKLSLDLSSKLKRVLNC